jgi:ADP-L-glycero-D-manno-heptose 6-epimerase
MSANKNLIVITGAAGFIGSGVVSYLNSHGHHSLVLVDIVNHPDKEKNLKDKKYFQLLGISELMPWLKGRETEIKAIIHLGACSDTMETNTQYLQENNTNYTMQLAAYALKNGIRFIYASSAATYGDGSCGFSDDHDVLETLKPLNPYGKSKHNFDLWAKKEGVLDQMVGLKYFNVFGPNECHKGHMASLVYKMVPLAQNEGVVRLFKSSEPDRFGDGDQCRDFIYVKDAVRMTCGFLDNDVCGIFNIGRGTPTTWNELAQAIFAALGQTPQVDYIDMPADLLSKYQNYTCAEMKKYRKMQKLLFDYDIEKAVQDYVQNYLLKDHRW